MFNIPFSKLNDPKTIGLYDAMIRNFKSSPMFKTLVEQFIVHNHSISSPNNEQSIEEDVRTPDTLLVPNMDFLLETLTADDGIDVILITEKENQLGGNCWMVLLEPYVGNNKWTLMIDKVSYEEYCSQNPYLDYDYELSRMMLHELWHYIIRDEPKILSLKKCKYNDNSTDFFSEKQKNAETEDELFCMLVIFGKKEAFASQLQDINYRINEYIYQAPIHGIHGVEIMQYLSLCEQQKWHYIECGFEFVNDMPQFDINDLPDSIIKQKFFPNRYNSDLIVDLSTPNILVSENTKIAEVYEKNVKSFSLPDKKNVFKEKAESISVGNSEFDKKCFFCIAECQDAIVMKISKDTVTVKSIYCLGQLKEDNSF